MLLPFVIGCLYQFILSYCGLREYVLYGPDHTFARDTFISANREGLFSCFGYLSLYFFGIVIGRQFFKSQRKQLRDYLTVLIQFASAGAVFIGATALLSILIEPVSRRLANITYIFWIVSSTYLNHCHFSSYYIGFTVFPWNINCNVC
jgi:phosphatidylinositol glycan class W